MSRIRMLYYAQLREESGCSEEEVETDATTLTELYHEMSARHGFSLECDHLKVAVNDEFKDWSTPLEDGAQVVFIPPVAGGAPASFGLTDSAISPAAESGQLQNPRAGALATFEGWVRDHNEGKDVAHLEYEAYASMAVKEGERILDEARDRFEILDARCAHRTGDLAIGEIAVWVGVSSVHRGPAFDACEYIIDQVKVRVPIWKKEHYTDGDSGWVACHECAQHAAHGE